MKTDTRNYRVCVLVVWGTHRYVSKWFVVGYRGQGSDAAVAEALTRARRQYPDAIRFLHTGTGRTAKDML